LVFCLGGENPFNGALWPDVAFERGRQRAGRDRGASIERLGWTRLTAFATPFAGAEIALASDFFGS